MAGNAFGVNDANAVKLWSKKLAAEIIPATYAGKFMGTGADSLIQIKTEMNKTPGDNIKYSLRMRASGAGTTEGQTQEGNEESLTLYQDNLTINELGHAHRVKSEATIDWERIPFNMRDEAKSSLRDWWADRIDQSLFNHLCGNTVQTDTRYTGFNAVTAPSNFIRAGGVANDQSLSSNNFTVSLIDKAVEVAKTRSPRIRPIRVNGKDMWVMFIHPYQTTSLRTDTGTGGWLDIQRALIQGGDSVANNAIFNGALGVWNNVIIHESEYVPLGINSGSGVAVANTRRAVLCGAQAAAVGFGQKYGASKYKWVEETFDYERELGVRASTVFGVKKVVYNSIDFATVVVSTSATAAT